MGKLNTLKAGHQRFVIPRPGVPDSQRGGFALIEVLIALTILSIGIVAAVSAIHASTSLASRANYVAEATNVTRTLAESVRIEPPTLGLHSGTSSDGRFAWEIQVAPWHPPAVADKDGRSIASGSPSRSERSVDASRLFLVSTRVRWAERGRERVLQTQELTLEPLAGGP